MPLRSHLFARALLAVLFGAVLLACERHEPLLTVIDEYRPSVQRVLERAQAVGVDAAAQPRVTEASLRVTRPVVFVAAYRDAVPTAAIELIEDLATLAAPVHSNERIAGATMLPECASLLLRGGRQDHRHLDQDLPRPRRAPRPDPGAADDRHPRDHL